MWCMLSLHDEMTSTSMCWNSNYYSDLGAGRGGELMRLGLWACVLVCILAYYMFLCVCVCKYVDMFGLHVCDSDSVCVCVCIFVRARQTLISNVFLNHPMLMFLFPLCGPGSSPTTLNQHTSFKICLLLLPNGGDTGVHSPTFSWMPGIWNQVLILIL